MAVNYNEKILANKRNPKKLWETLKSAINMQSNNEDIKEIKSMLNALLQR